MAPKPWIATIAVTTELSRKLLQSQFPQLAPIELEKLGLGWDNTAFLVNGTYVFRFPRRQIAVGLLEAECRVLPKIRNRLPLAIPYPEFLGQPDVDYPWPFAGYRLLPGRTACTQVLDDRRRIEAAEVLAHFFKALHAIPAEEASRLGARPETLNRLNLEMRVPLLQNLLKDLAQQQLIEDVLPLLGILETLPKNLMPKATTLVHGDLYAQHLLVHEQGHLCGVIDWGDVHLGDPASDLSIVTGWLPLQGREVFESIYGNIDEATWKVAQFKALQTAAFLIQYGSDVEDRKLEAEGQRVLNRIAIQL